MTRALVPLMFAAALGACVADNGDEGIFILKNVKPEAGCVFTASATSPFITRGQVSVFSPDGYQLHPQMKSRITAAVGQEDQRTVITRGARIDLEIVDKALETAMGGAASLQSMGITKFEIPFTAPISPNGGITDGSFELITRRFLDEVVRASGANDTATPFRTEIMATVVVYGDMAGAEVTSNPFRYPVTICNDCVANVLGACPLPMDTVIREGNACNAYQDDPVDCCLQGTEVVCPAILATTPPV